jgi:hypothetical protein
MKLTATAFALTIFAGTAMAATDQEVYAGFAKNPDLGHDLSHMQARGASLGSMGESDATQRSRGTNRSDIYRGFEEGNPDLW